MGTESTAVRGLPEGTLRKFRLLTAQLIKDNGCVTSMNSLYVKALYEFINKPKNKKLIEK